MAQKLVVILFVFLISGLGPITFGEETEGEQKFAETTSGSAPDPEDDKNTESNNYFNFDTFKSHCFVQKALQSVAIGKLAGLTLSAVGVGPAGPVVAAGVAFGYLGFAMRTCDGDGDKQNGTTVSINLSIL